MLSSFTAAIALRTPLRQYNTSGADVIIGLAPVLPDFMGPRTVLICSGILDIRLADVTDALEAAGLTVTAIRSKEEWRCVPAKKGGSL